MAALRILLLTFISRFVIDFLSIRKVIIFSAIATDDRHPLRSRSIHQNAANCMTIRFRYIAQRGRGYGKRTAHAHVMMFDALSRVHNISSPFRDNRKPLIFQRVKRWIRT